MFKADESGIRDDSGGSARAMKMFAKIGPALSSFPGLGASRTSTRRPADIKGGKKNPGLFGAEDLRGGIKFTTAL